MLAFWTSLCPASAVFIPVEGSWSQGPGKEFPTLRLLLLPGAQGNRAKMWRFGQELLPWEVSSVRGDPQLQGSWVRGYMPWVRGLQGKLGHVSGGGAQSPEVLQPKSSPGCRRGEGAQKGMPGLEEEKSSHYCKLWRGHVRRGPLTLLTQLARKARVTHAVCPLGGRGLAVAVEAPQAPTGVHKCPGLVAQSPRVPILALAVVGKSVEGHTLPVDTPREDREKVL